MLNIVIIKKIKKKSVERIYAPNVLNTISYMVGRSRQSPPPSLVNQNEPGSY